MGQFETWDLFGNVQKYIDYERKCQDRTPYHFTDYLLAEEKAEEGKTKVFLYEDEAGFALYTGVVRMINALPYMGGLKEKFYDLITPHEYGGIISNRKSKALKKMLLENIAQYCMENNIIFQFDRINPYLVDLPDVYKEEKYELIHSSSQVYVNLDQAESEIIFDYKPNVRRNIKRAEKEGLIFEIARKTEENIDVFQHMYQKAMEILGAKKFLYFNENYFRELMACNCIRLGAVRDKDNRIIAAGIMLLGEETVYYHLGCFDRKYSLKRPMNYLMHLMILWSKRNGYKVFHLGGGSKSLMQFKEGYSSTRIDYYVADKICNDGKYQEICEEWKQRFPQYRDERYYPLYRYNE